MAQKQFTTAQNVGKAKYVISYHDGIKTHSDGSPFFDIEILSNKKEFKKKINSLKTQNYHEN